MGLLLRWLILGLISWLRLGFVFVTVLCGFGFIFLHWRLFIMCDSCCRDVETRILFDDEGVVEGLFCDGCAPALEAAYGLELAPVMVAGRGRISKRAAARKRDRAA